MGGDDEDDDKHPAKLPVRVWVWATGDFMLACIQLGGGDGVGALRLQLHGLRCGTVSGHGGLHLLCWTISISLNEVAAAVSVLLGLAPPPSLATDSSSKVLLPNPFERPRSIFMLEVEGYDDPLLLTDNSKAKVGSVFKCRVQDSIKAEIQLPSEDEVSIAPLDESLTAECNVACLDKELGNLADLLGGSYVGSLESQDGKLTLPVASGSALKLHVKKLHVEVLTVRMEMSYRKQTRFASNLISLLRSIKKGAEIHEDFAGNIVSPAELLIGRFTGIKTLEDEYGPGDIVSQGTEVLCAALTKAFDLLQKAYEGKFVGVVIYKRDPTAFSKPMIDVTYPSQVAITEVLLVRRSLAWITGIILVISTLIGVYLLLNMPLTRDILLYSNVKLD
ncbi:uncharacterized protein [Typha latifolia]|uniref:uncharacterized protein n=1 Tax=Typha latifolia TaxID=4733 RepID=UPI003C2BF646